LRHSGELDFTRSRPVVAERAGVYASLPVMPQIRPRRYFQYACCFFFRRAGQLL
jgi:hypothetical protein